MCPRSGVRSEGTCERTLVPVFVLGEHPNVPSFRFSFRGNIRQDHPFGNHPLSSSDPWLVTEKNGTLICVPPPNLKAPELRSLVSSDFMFLLKNGTLLFGKVLSGLRLLTHKFCVCQAVGFL